MIIDKNKTPAEIREEFKEIYNTEIDPENPIEIKLKPVWKNDETYS